MKKKLTKSSSRVASIAGKWLQYTETQKYNCMAAALLSALIGKPKPLKILVDNIDAGMASVLSQKEKP